MQRDAPALVFVEHDASFVDRVATGRVELVPTAHKDTLSARTVPGRKQETIAQQRDDA